MVASITWPSPFTLCLGSLHISLALPRLPLFLKHPWFGYIPSFLMLWVRYQPWKCTSNIMVFSGLVWSQVLFRGRPEWGFKKLEPEPDFLSKISVLINRNRIFSFPIRFLIDRNRNFERSFRFLINRNRNFGWLPDFRFLIRFGHPLSLRAGMCTRYKHEHSK